MIDMTKSFGAASAIDLADFERRRGISLPHQYKTFLSQQNGGLPNLGEFVVPGWGESVANSFYGICVGGVHDIERAIESFKDVIPVDMMPIGNDPGGNQICLGVKGDRFGKIYFWDHNDWDDDGNPSLPIEISTSVDIFFDSCKI